MLIDTGSFELWVNPVCAASNVPDFCQVFGHYHPALSSTSRKVGDHGFNIKYGSGQVSGDYYKDDIYISGKLCSFSSHRDEVRFDGSGRYWELVVCEGELTSEFHG